MKFNKIILAMLSVSLLASCSSGGESQVEESQELTINGYNSINDLYRSKLVYPFSSYSIECRFDINTDKTYVKEGSGSLKMYMNSVVGGEYSYFVQRFSESEAKTRNLADIDKFSLWLYNAQDTVAKATLVLVGEGDKAVTSLDFSLQPNQWNYCEYDLSRLIMETCYESLLGFGVLLNETPGTYYLDDWKVYFGAKYTQEDLAILDKVNAVSDLVSKLNLNMDFTKEGENAALEEACSSYYAIDSAYRGSVKGSEDLEKLASSYCTYLTTSSGGTTAFSFGNPAGVSQAEVSMLSAGVSIAYSSEYKRPDQKGSLKVSSNGNSKWAYLNLTTSADVVSYSKFGIWFYNASEQEYGFCIQWNDSAKYIKPSSTISSDDGWQYIEYSCAGLSGEVEFEYCAVADGIPGGVLDTIGDLYIGDIVLIK